jgi:hypothetical protein
LGKVGKLRISSAVELDNCDSFVDLPPSLRHVHSRSARANSQVKTVSKELKTMMDFMLRGRSISDDGIIYKPERFHTGYR